MSRAAQTLFASDLHLDSEAPWAIDAFLAFLAGPARDADSLYLLGDLFEAWVGDDDDNADNARACDGLARLTAGGTAVYAIHGNRDFLLGEGFEKRTGVKLLPDPVSVELHGVPTLLSHGDVFCTDDLPYQELRSIVRSAKRRSAAGFQDVMMPSRVLLTMTSSDDSMTAAKCRSATSVFRRSVMSRATLEAPTTRPSASLTGETVSGQVEESAVFGEAHRLEVVDASPRRMRARRSSSSARRSSGTIRVMCCPMASTAVQPKSARRRGSRT